MNAVSLDMRVLALSLDHARAGLDAARAQQPAGLANPAQVAPPADASGAVLELSAAAQALMTSS
jgi:hypothetical protein